MLLSSSTLLSLLLLLGCETWWTTQTMQHSTSVWGASTNSNGKRRSEMKICGSERDRNQWPSRYCGGCGAGSDTPSGSQHPAPHAKPWPGTRRGRGREAGLATVGGETLKQSWNSRGPTGPEWQEQPRTEYDGGGSLMAYAPLGAMGISKYYLGTWPYIQRTIHSPPVLSWGPPWPGVCVAVCCGPACWSCGPACCPPCAGAAPPFWAGGSGGSSCAGAATCAARSTCGRCRTRMASHLWMRGSFHLLPC